MARGTAIFLDGIRPVRHTAEIKLDAGALVVAGPNGVVLALWPYPEIRLLETQLGVARLVRETTEGRAGLERLELSDPVLIAAIEAACPTLRRKARLSRGTMAKIAALAALAVLSVGGILIYGVPAAAHRLAPMVPPRFEASLGRVAEGQIRAILRPRGGRWTCETQAGREALNELTARLTEGTHFAVPPRVSVVDVGVPNAMALPGGQIYLFRGLISRAQSVDEVAGVLAHELGHVHGRHVMRMVLQTAPTAFVLGLLVGDFAGAGAIAGTIELVLGAGFSREAEREADLLAVDLVLRAGGDARALGRILTRISREAGERGRDYLASHPFTPDRIAAIEARLTGQETVRPLLTEKQWLALRRMCD